MLSSDDISKVVNKKKKISSVTYKNIFQYKKMYKIASVKRKMNKYFMNTFFYLPIANVFYTTSNPYKSEHLQCSCGHLLTFEYFCLKLLGL